ncbi:MAG: hypothetical protein ACKPKO_06725, partial [Candidatus Fonsibacter sp.]
STSPTTWVAKCRIESTRNSYISGTMNVIGDILSSNGSISTTSGNMSAGSITTSGNITCATGTINARTIKCTGNTSGSWINNPPAVGVYLKNTVVSTNGFAWMELCGSNSGTGYIEFTTVNADSRGRYSYSLG